MRSATSCCVTSPGSLPKMVLIALRIPASCPAECIADWLGGSVLMRVVTSHAHWASGTHPIASHNLFSSSSRSSVWVCTKASGTDWRAQYLDADIRWRRPALVPRASLACMKLDACLCLKLLRQEVVDGARAVAPGQHVKCRPRTRTTSLRLPTSSLTCPPMRCGSQG